MVTTVVWSYIDIKAFTSYEFLNLLTFLPLSRLFLLLLFFSDSKTLKEEDRENLFAQIQECNDFMGFEVEILSPNFISTTMLRR